MDLSNNKNNNNSNIFGEATRASQEGSVGVLKRVGLEHSEIPIYQGTSAGSGAAPA